MAIPDSNGQLHAVYQTPPPANGTALNIIDPDTGSPGDGQAEVSWNHTGPAGSQGPQGVQGEQGVAGAIGLQGVPGSVPVMQYRQMPSFHLTAFNRGNDPFSVEGEGFLSGEGEALAPAGVAFLPGYASSQGGNDVSYVWSTSCNLLGIWMISLEANIHINLSSCGYNGTPYVSWWALAVPAEMMQASALSNQDLEQAPFILAPKLFKGVPTLWFPAGVPTSQGFDVTGISGGGWCDPTSLTFSVEGTRPPWIDYDAAGRFYSTGQEGNEGQVYPLTVTATNAYGGDGLSFQIAVPVSPVIMSCPDTASFLLHEFSSIQISATGIPAPEISAVGPMSGGRFSSPTFPAGLRCIDHGDGTGEISGVASVAGDYPITVSASNPSVNQATHNMVITVS